jgi:predicted secreted protein
MKTIKGTTFLSILFLLSLSFVSKVYGDNNNKPEDNTYLNLSVLESTLVEQDLLIASLRYDVESESSKLVQDKINQTMKKALAIAEKKSMLDISTERYSVYKYSKQVKGKSDTKEIWNGSQTIVIKGKATEDILALSGELQEMGLVMNDLRYELSVEKYEETRASMTEKAVNKLLFQAKKMADIIGAKKIKILNISIEGDNRFQESHQVLMRSAIINSSETITAPVSSPGKMDVKLIVSASVSLKD